MAKILFQGDSITDCGRSREDNNQIGQGYPRLVKARLCFDHPGEHTFLNRGISGNRVVDIYARIKSDIINLEPDYMSILIGVNDVWHEAAHKNGVDAPKYEKIYDMLITEVREALPNIRIAIFEPFVLKGTANADNWEFFSSEVALRAQAAKRIAEKHGLVFIPLQEKFDKLCEIMPPYYWAGDGVHPTAAGHELITREWIRAFENMQ